jgi:alkylation response protein AidB-like acyl-CoA dehydrogenase
MPPSSPDNLAAHAADVAERLWGSSEAVDSAATLPTTEIEWLKDAGLLSAPLADPAVGGSLIEDLPLLREILSTIGSASLTVGRLYEGHVNAATLVRAYGRAGAVEILNEEVAHGRISGVWNAERQPGPHITRADGGWSLSGTKIFCSGAGAIRRPVVTARDADGEVLMLLPDMTDPGVTIDLSGWRATGMRGTATGTVHFDQVIVPDLATIGIPGDYYRSPLFSGGAWRVLAVQLGGLQRILALHAAALEQSGRNGDPVVRARFATAAAAYELARLLVEAAADRTGRPQATADEIDAYVDQARGAFEPLALAVIEAARRNVGLGSFIAPHALDRTIRDLETYLRQPFLDVSRDSAARWLLSRGGRFES